VIVTTAATAQGPAGAEAEAEQQQEHHPTTPSLTHDSRRPTEFCTTILFNTSHSLSLSLSLCYVLLQYVVLQHGQDLQREGYFVSE
jgi:hypothetical protein